MHDKGVYFHLPDGVRPFRIYQGKRDATGEGEGKKVEYDNIKIEKQE